MRLRLIPLLLASTLSLTGSAGAESGPHVGPVTDYVKANVLKWLSDPLLIEAIRAQNAAHAGLDPDAVAALDQQWRSEAEEGGARPLVDATLNNAVSAFLKEKQNASEGMISEVFVMDNKGLNVGQSGVTSDYWQGDEAKFEKSFGAGAGAIFVDEAEKDESSQVLQSQVSLTISDEKGVPIGAITLGINLDQI